MFQKDKFNSKRVCPVRQTKNRRFVSLCPPPIPRQVTSRYGKRLYTQRMFAPLHAAFASARHGSDNSSSSIRSVSSAFLRTGRRNRQPCQDKTVYTAEKARRSYRLCAGTSSSFYQKRIIRFSPEKSRFIPHRPSFPCPDMEKGSSISQPKKPFALLSPF